MSSAFKTLTKILSLEQNKNYQNQAVVGGLGRFASHWAREAHGQAKTEELHTSIEHIAALLREYDEVAEAERPALIDNLMALISRQALPAVTMKNIDPPAVEHQNEDMFSTTEKQGVAAIQTEASIKIQEAALPQSVRERRRYSWQEHVPADDTALAHLKAPLASLKGIGEKRAEMLGRLRAQTIEDLLFLFPRRYDDYSRMSLIRQLKLGEEVSVIGVIKRISVQRPRSGTQRVEAYLEDDTGSIRLNWFNQPWLANRLKEDEPMVASGKVEQYLGRLVMNSPELEPLESEWLQAGRVVPIYPLTKGLSGRTMRKLQKHIVELWSPRLPEYLPASVRESADLMDYGDAVSQAHFPDSWQDKEDALHRLAFDELFVMNLALLQQRYEWQSHSGIPIHIDDDWIAQFELSLPYQLTDAQRRAISEIRTDLASDVPMNRLLQGDVGSGKTIVAAISMGMASANGLQATLLAPTSILAEQHYNNLRRLFEGQPIQIALLTAGTPAAERAAILSGLADGSIHIAVGTHALIQPDVKFATLGLAIIDEQHRFGVEQRASLRDKGGDNHPHLLVTTATPIPRTLALTLHANLDLTVIDEMPPGRTPVDTKVIQPKERERVFAFIRAQVESGRQAYIIYPLIEESEKLSAKAATTEFKRLQNTIFTEFRIGLLHGRMKAAEKESVMENFYRGAIDILVSTSVIEVGIDNPNASVILVEGANRFGLAQLHQLRGRVGRGEYQSYCLLMSDKSFITTDERLDALEKTTDGFELAQIDWQLRGAGDLLGTRQSGFARFRFANLMDTRLVETVQKEALGIYQLDPDLTAAEHLPLARRVRAFTQQAELS
jgi:ATP-dependent DNA helicase RecG